MELREAQKYVEDVRLHLLQHSSATDYGPCQKDEALICLAAKVTELEAQNKKLVEELVETIAYHINPIKPPPPKMAFALKKIKQAVGSLPS